MNINYISNNLCNGRFCHWPIICCPRFQFSINWKSSSGCCCIGIDLNLIRIRGRVSVHETSYIYASKHAHNWTFTHSHTIWWIIVLALWIVLCSAVILGLVVFRFWLQALYRSMVCQYWEGGTIDLCDRLFSLLGSFPCETVWFRAAGN